MSSRVGGGGERAPARPAYARRTAQGGRRRAPAAAAHDAMTARREPRGAPAAEPVRRRHRRPVAASGRIRMAHRASPRLRTQETLIGHRPPPLPGSRPRAIGAGVRGHPPAERTAPSASLPSPPSPGTEAEALTMAKHRGRGMAAINYPIGMNLGGDPSQALVHSNPAGKFTVALSSIDLGQGMKSVTRQICAETLGRAGRGRLRRHRRFRHRPPLHGQLRLPRHPPGRQRRDGGGARGARRHDGGGGRGARGQRRRPRHRRPRQHPRQGRAAPLDLRQGRGGRGAVQAGPDHLRPRHLPGAAVGGRSGDGRDEPGDLLRPCLPRRRGRGRRRDRRGRHGTHGLGLRARPRAQPEARRAAARRRRLDGGEPRPLRDAGALLPRPEPRPARLQRIRDARPRRHLPARHRRARAACAGRPLRRQGSGRDVRQPGSAGGRQRDLQRRRGAHQRSADHAREGAARR